MTKLMPIFSLVFSALTMRKAAAMPDISVDSEAAATGFILGFATLCGVLILAYIATQRYIEARKREGVYRKYALPNDGATSRHRADE